MLRYEKYFYVILRNKDPVGYQQRNFFLKVYCIIKLYSALTHSLISVNHLFYPFYQCKTNWFKIFCYDKRNSFKLSCFFEVINYKIQSAQITYSNHKIFVPLWLELSIFTAFCRNFSLWCDAAGATLFIYFLLLKCTSHLVTFRQEKI